MSKKYVSLIVIMLSEVISKLNVIAYCQPLSPFFFFFFFFDKSSHNTNTCPEHNLSNILKFIRSVFTYRLIVRIVSELSFKKYILLPVPFYIIPTVLHVPFP